MKGIDAVRLSDTNGWPGMVSDGLWQAPPVGVRATVIGWQVGWSCLRVGRYLHPTLLSVVACSCPLAHTKQPSLPFLCFSPSLPSNTTTFVLHPISALNNHTLTNNTRFDSNPTIQYTIQSQTPTSRCVSQLLPPPSLV